MFIQNETFIDTDLLLPRTIIDPNFRFKLVRQGETDKHFGGSCTINI